MNAAAAASQLQVTLTPLVLRPRTTGPTPVEVSLRWDGARLLEGRLDLTVRDGGRAVGRYRSGELALTTGEQNLRILLPTLPPGWDSQADVQMAFLSGGRRYNLEPGYLWLAKPGERSLVMAVCAGRDTASPAWRATERSLRMDHFRPASREESSLRELSTTLARLTADDLPAQPLAYCAYDAVVMTPDALAEARERPLEALGRWVLAGGSLCVFAGRSIGTERLQFLNRLSDDALAPALDDAGRLRPGALLRLHAGLGRLVVVPAAPPSDADLDTAEWRRSVAFLWKARQDVSDEMERDGTWSAKTNVVAARSARTAVPPPMSFGRLESDVGRNLVASLMPRTVRLVPLHAMVGMLTLFVLCIGPGDWFLLGRWRRRRLTWVLFPATTAVFTLAMVAMAGRYLGDRDQRRALVVVDVGRHGTVLRQNRYELVFASRDRQVATELRGALWSLVVRGTDAGYYRGGSYRGGPTREEEPPLTEGMPPGAFSVSRVVRQWQPELGRALSFDPPETPLLPIDWDAAEALARSRADVRAVPSTAPGRRLPAIDVYAFGGSGDRNWAQQGLLPADLVRDLCHDARGLFGVLSQLSPAGGDSVEDLLAFDRSDPGQCLLVVLARAGEDIVMYRRLYHER
jgi:hypothetical protein